MHDNPLRIKVEVEDGSASPSPAPKITGTDVKMKDLMSDVASMKALAEEAITESAATVASAAAEESAAAAAAALSGNRIQRNHAGGHALTCSR